MVLPMKKSQEIKSQNNFIQTLSSKYNGLVLQTLDIASASVITDSQSSCTNKEMINTRCETVELKIIIL